MSKPTRTEAKSLFKDGTFNRQKMSLLVDLLWRDLQALYAESKLAETDINKADSEHAEYDPRYKFVRDIIGSTASYAQSLGFNNTLNGEFSKSIGFGNVLNAMFEIVLGSYSEAAEGNPDEWIPTDRLLTIANGEDSENRSNALEVFKSGLFKLFNAVVLGKYKHGEGEDAVEPLPGTLQFDEVLQIFRTAWEQILSVDLETVALNTIPKIVEDEGVRTIQWVAAPEGGASSYLALSDTPAAYPAHGNLPRGAADGVPWSENVGDDGEVWVRSQHNSTDGPNILVGGSATLVAGKTYKITVTIAGRTVGSVAVQINADTIATLTATGTVAHVAATSSAHSIAAVPSPDFDGTVTSITVQLVTVTSRKGLRFVNELREVLAELLFFNGNSVINSALPADFFGTGNTYLDATVTDAAEKDKMRLAGILYDKISKLLELPGALSINTDGDRIDFPTTPPVVGEGEESKRFALVRTGLNSKLTFEELVEYVSPLIETLYLGVPAYKITDRPHLILEGVTNEDIMGVTMREKNTGKLFSIHIITTEAGEVAGIRLQDGEGGPMWFFDNETGELITPELSVGELKYPSAAPSAPSVAIFAADGTTSYVGYQHATEPSIVRAKPLSVDAFNALVTAGTVDPNVIYLQYEED